MTTALIRVGPEHLRSIEAALQDIEALVRLGMPNRAQVVDDLHELAYRMRDEMHSVGAPQVIPLRGPRDAA